MYTLARDSDESIEIIDSDDDAGDGDSVAGGQCDPNAVETARSEPPAPTSMADETDGVSSTCANDIESAMALAKAAINANNAERYRPQSGEASYWMEESTQLKAVDGRKLLREIEQQKNVQAEHGARQAAKRPCTFLAEVGESFKTKVKVKVAKYSRGEMLIADLLSARRAS